MTTTATTTTTTAKNGAHGRAAGPVQGAVHEVRDALEGMGRSMPDMARASRAAVNDMFSAIEAGSDERVSAGVTLSLGLAIGLLIGGAPRLLIALALAPLAAMGLVLADRRAAAAKLRA
ncbi:MAG TPA: hypothetical protein VE011_10335 [Candidatus Dormibacteraeota bacterium]|nr:hypothetical protein [Candidatus Dormibacteraeota bacterium]